MALDAHFAFYQRDSRSRSRLARDVEIGLLEFQGRSLQIDHSARFEDYDAGAFLPDGPCERSFALFVEVRDADDPEIAVAERRVTFCASGKIGRFPDQCGESFLRCRGPVSEPRPPGPCNRSGRLQGAVKECFYSSWIVGFSFFSYRLPLRAGSRPFAPPLRRSSTP